MINSILKYYERHKMHKHFASFLTKFDHQIENQGDKLVITLSGDKEELKKMEKALKALHELHEVCQDGGDCCGGGCC